MNLPQFQCSLRCVSVIDRFELVLRCFELCEQVKSLIQESTLSLYLDHTPRKSSQSAETRSNHTFNFAENSLISQSSIALEFISWSHSSLRHPWNASNRQQDGKFCEIASPHFRSENFTLNWSNVTCDDAHIAVYFRHVSVHQYPIRIQNRKDDLKT